MMRLTGHRKRWPALRLCRFARVLEQEVQGFVRLDVAGDAAHRAILLKFHVHGGHRLALLASDPFHFGVDCVARGMNALALADLAEQHRCLDLADGLLALRFLHLVPVQLQFPRIDALLGHGQQALLHAIFDLALHERFRHREIMRVHQFVHNLVLGVLLRLVLALGEERSEEHTSELQSLRHLVCRLLLERYGDHRDLHSFPTRRSSDLGKSCASTSLSTIWFLASCCASFWRWAKMALRTASFNSSTVRRSEEHTSEL